MRPWIMGWRGKTWRIPALLGFPIACAVFPVALLGVALRIPGITIECGAVRIGKPERPATPPL